MQEQTFHMWPWQEEAVSVTEYAYALHDLNRFLAQVEVRELQTLEDVSAVASLVGHDLHVLTRTKGKRIEKKIERFEPGASEPIRDIEKIDVLRASFGNHELGVTVRGGHAALTKHRLVGFQLYQCEELRVRLPTDRDIAVGGKPNVSEHSLYAIDVRGEGIQQYSPVTDPADAHIQQGFIRVLKEVVRDIVSALTLTF
jgi:hypothetical protein